jgi:hypothetical protein
MLLSLRPQARRATSKSGPAILNGAPLVPLNAAFAFGGTRSAGAQGGRPGSFKLGRASPAY